MILGRIFVIFCLAYGSISCALYPAQEAKPWTWLFKTFFNAEQRTANGAKKEIGFAANDTPYFTQSIFSWNAQRPKKGYFSFYAQVRDAQTKKWHVWHKMFDWGDLIQRSHLTISQIGTSYHYVRLEVPTALPADALRIRIEAHKGAQLSDVCGLFVSISRLDAFIPEKQTAFFTLPSVHIKGVPLYSQKVLDHPRKDVLCSPTSLAMVTSFLSHKEIDPCAFAQKVHDKGLDVFGSWPFNTAHAFELAEGKYFFYVRRLPSFTVLHALLRRNIPVVVSVRGILPGGAKEYGQGHLLVVTGWNQSTKMVFCHDPAFDKNEAVAVQYPIKDFLVAWERSRRLAYCAEPRVL